MPVREQVLMWCRRGRVGAALAGVALGCGGCASPGPPKPPSLQLPAAVTDLQATRHGDRVELVFGLPTETTEGLPYRGKAFHAAICRAVGSGACVPVKALADVAFSGGSPGRANLQDPLPPELAMGTTRLLTYRVQLSNDRGKTAGYGDAAYSAAGAAPTMVTGLRAEGSRQGVAVRWAPGGSGAADVVLQREAVSGPEAATSPRAGGATSRERGPTGKGAGKKRNGEEPGVVWLSTSPKPDPLGGEVRETAPAHGANGVLDDGATVGNTYRYAAERQLTAQLGGHAVVLHSALSAPVEVALRAVYPPPAPTDLVGTLFPLAPGEAAGQQGGLAVDLIWTPADDSKTVGYNVVREILTKDRPGVSSRRKLNDAPVKMPAFHDVLPGDLVEAADRVRFQYSVTAVDANGMESPAAVTVVGRF